ncbi:MAG: 16S rRNA (cytosine(967)-C(5))-methyltransferase RsmB [Deltaproteobacteria bacterium]|nr:16S rRNA (cytosine(967)-C(5))-methyltransferase RsmB [Deltaproteobacteria bacterium]
MKSSPRGLAVNILNRVDQKNAYAEPLLNSYLSRDYITNVRDRRLLTELVYGTLRMRNHLDWIISSLYKGKPKSMEIGLKNILRTALYQIMYTDRIPAFAAVDEAVKITQREYPGRDRLVNAILRNALRTIDTIIYPAIEKEPIRYISIVHSHPEWIVARWTKRFGMDETISLCKCNNETPPLTLRVNTIKTDRDEIVRKLRKDGYDVRETEFSSSGIIIPNPSSPIQKLQLYTDGYLQIQDEASQLVAYITDPKPGETLLDLCSGVGIKTTHLAELMRNSGKILAVDINRKKSQALQTLSEKLDITITVQLMGNATEDLGKNYHEKFDRVLVDAPCSGLGTLRRNPEIKWRIKEHDIKNSTILQKKILHSAARYPKKGGIIVYCTCSIESEENENVVRDFLSTHPDYRQMTPHAIMNFDMLDENGFFKTYPHRHGTDGFFAAVLLRT